MKKMKARGEKSRSEEQARRRKDYLKRSCKGNMDDEEEA